MPPLSFFLNLMFGGCLFKRMAKPSSSFSMIPLCVAGFAASSTMRMTLHVRAVLMT
jgi:hypothetical protein